jgi:hypothetical protein
MPSIPSTTEGETARHYGNMRFAMFTVFTAITGALLTFPFSVGGTAFLSVWHHKVLLCVVGIILAVLFALAEYRISYLVTFYQEAAFKSKSLPEPVNHYFWKKVVVLTMVVPYVFAAMFWILFAIGALDVTGPPTIG